MSARCFGLAAALFLFIPAAPAQEDASARDAKAEEILRAAVDHLAQADSVAVDVNFTVSVQAGENTAKEERFFRVATEQPNRYGRFMVSGKNVDEVRISDGTHVYHYLDELNAYDQNPAPESFDKLFEDDQLARMTLIGPIMATGGYEAAFVEDVDELSYEGTRTVEDAEYHVVTLEEREQTRELLLTQTTPPIISRVQVANKQQPMVLTFDFHNWRINEELPEVLFTFNPPSGIRKVSSLAEEIELSQGGGTRSALLDKKAPDFELESLSGETVRLQDHFEKDIVILDFWATWCGPCVRAMPELVSVTDEYKDRNVVFYAVNLREDAALIEPFLERLKLSPTVLLDPQGTVGDRYQAKAIPHTVVIDKQGIVRATHSGFGPDTAGQLRKEIEGLLEEK